MNKGSLIVVGTGIKTVGQMTMEAISHLRGADHVLYVVGDVIADEVIHQLNPSCESLAYLYEANKPRISTYEEMVEQVLNSVRSGLATCLACYGHPGVFVYPSHEAVRRARAEGFPAKILPGISAEDCLFADLGVDPAVYGCQSYEATDFLVNSRGIDPSSSTILWQVGVVGDSTYQGTKYDMSALPLLVQRLLRVYPPTHTGYVYEAAVLPETEPVIRPAPLYALESAGLSPASTLYIPPAQPPAVDGIGYHQWGLARY